MTDDSLAYDLLLVLGDQLDDIESSRVAAANRYRSLTTTWMVDGVVFGKGLNPELAACRAVAEHVAGIELLEHRLILEVRRALRRHPLGPWVARTVGVGEKQAARLLAVVGDPAARANPAKLWAFCGLHVVDSRFGGDSDQLTGDTQELPVGVAPSLKRGAKANWNGEARKRVWLIASSCVKQARSPYRVVYDDGRVKYADATHSVVCVRCGPSGSPAQPGSLLSLGHQHARAMRLVMKRVLLDMWREARAVANSGGDPDHPQGDTHGSPVGVAPAPSGGDPDQRRSDTHSNPVGVAPATIGATT